MTISASKPSVAPRWASVSPGTVRLEPSSGQKDTGWTNTQRPPFDVMNWLQGVQYDWQQYLEQATDQLESSKINKTGATDLSGTFQPTTAGGASFGSGARPLGTVQTQLLKVGTDGVQTNLDPDASISYRLGYSSKKWLSGYIAGLTVDTLNVATDGCVSDLVPSTTGARSLGSASKLWLALFVGSVTASGGATFGSNVTAPGVLPASAGTGNVGSGLLAYLQMSTYALRARTLSVYRRTAPAASADLALQSALTAVLAQVKQTSSTATAAWASAYNVNTGTSVRTGTAGTYTVVLPAAIPTNAVILVTCGNGGYVGTATQTSTTGITVETRLLNGTTQPLTDIAWSLVVLGDHGVTDPLT